jgi:peptidoglycan/xylan/chitin deacetylase (PgdA/CDA1 family)
MLPSATFLLLFAIGLTQAIALAAFDGTRADVTARAQPATTGLSPDPPRAVKVVDALRLPPERGVRTVVSLTFDDALADQHALARLLPPHDLTATVYANSGMLADWRFPGYMSLVDLVGLAQHGVEIGGHTIDHPDLLALSRWSARRQICLDRDQLRSWGFRVVSFAYPSSRANPDLERLARTCGYRSARSVGGVACAGCTPAETFPPLDRYSLRTSDAVESRTSLAELKQQVRAAEESARVTGTRAWLILNFHHICDRCNKYSISEQRLTALLSWLARRPASTAVRAVGAVMLHGFK